MSRLKSIPLFQRIQMVLRGLVSMRLNQSKKYYDSIFESGDDYELKWLSENYDNLKEFRITEDGPLANVYHNDYCFLMTAVQTDKNEDWLIAARHGEISSMCRVLRNYNIIISNHERSFMLGRYILITGGTDRFYDHSESENEDRFIIGQELYGYDEFWDEGRHPHIHYQECIQHYKKVTNAARQSALQTIVVLRARGVSRDVAQLIGQIFYRDRGSC